MNEMKTRLSLDNELREFLGFDNVYFSPPESLKLRYPCIVYHRTGGSSMRANNGLYAFTFEYMVTIIDKDPDSGGTANSETRIEQMLAHFPMCRYSNHRVVNNLNHDTFMLYY